MIRAAALLAWLVLPACRPVQEKPAEEKKMKHTNRLSKEKSPYLLQHAHNPVDWHPWGQEAFDQAKKEDKPIFLSIGYSTCHWCHVMEKDSFEKDDVAAILNAKFVPIKVDREERPDVDQIYMAAVTQAMGIRGGWPLSVWMTPDRKPFYGGTYFPREHFKAVLENVSKVWGERRKDIEADADKVTQFLRASGEAKGAGEVDLDRALDGGFAMIQDRYEPQRGGFFAAQNKFPHGTTMQYLLRRHRRTGNPDALAMVEKTLVEMARGGICDQLGGGFHRYSTDPEWIVPHFEKMLYDNALLAVAYTEAWQLTKKELYAKVAKETLDYVLRDMASKEGGFHSAEDADSEGVEGKFYVWNPKQVREVLGADAERFMKAFDVTDDGNWDPHEASIPKNQSVLRQRQDGDFADLKKKLLEARAKRVRPGLDDKVLTSWNGLMISAMARAAQAWDEPRYRDAAVKAARFLLDVHRKDGRLLRTSRHGEAKLDGGADDYAFLAAALLDLYETTFDGAWYEEARALALKAVELFWDEKSGGIYYSPAGDATLIARMREDHEGPMPTASSVLAMTFLRLHALTGEEPLKDRAVRTIRSYKAELERFPGVHGWLLCAVDFLKGPAYEVALAGPDPGPLLRVVREDFVPNKVVALADGKARIPLLEGRVAVKGKAAAYVCESMSCKLPVTEPAKLRELLKK